LAIYLINPRLTEPLKRTNLGGKLAGYGDSHSNSDNIWGLGMRICKKDKDTEKKNSSNPDKKDSFSHDFTS